MPNGTYLLPLASLQVKGCSYRMGGTFVLFRQRADPTAAICATLCARGWKIAKTFEAPSRIILLPAAGLKCVYAFHFYALCNVCLGRQRGRV